MADERESRESERRLPRKARCPRCLHYDCICVVSVASEDTRERAAKAVYDSEGKPHGGYEDNPRRKGVRTYRNFEWEELNAEDKTGCFWRADAVLAVVSPSPGMRNALERVRDQAALEADDTPNGLVFSSIANEAERSLSVSPSPVDTDGTIGRLRELLAGDSHHEMATISGMLRLRGHKENDAQLTGWGDRLSEACRRIRDALESEPRPAAPPVGVDEGHTDARVTVGLSRMGPTGPKKAPAALTAEDREIDAINAGYEVWLDRQELTDNFDAYEPVARAIIASVCQSSAAPGVTEEMRNVLSAVLTALEVHAPEDGPLRPDAVIDAGRKTLEGVTEAPLRKALLRLVSQVAVKDQTTRRLITDALAVSPARYPSVFKAGSRETVESLSPAPTEGPDDA